MNSKFRLSKNKDFMRVRRKGKSYAHPLTVLLALPNGSDVTRIAVAASRAVGNAVQRNRAKRLLRENFRKVYQCVSPGWDLVLLSRKAAATASYEEVRTAVKDLLNRANLLIETNGT